MPMFTGSRSGVTSAATTDLIVLYAASGEIAKILEVGWSGEATSSIAMRTRLARASTAGSSPTTAVDIQQLDQQGTAATPKLDAVTTITTPTYAAGSLFPILGWNAHGGVVRWLASPEQEIWLVGAAAAAHITLRNEVGVATIDCGLTWRE